MLGYIPPVKTFAVGVIATTPRTPDGKSKFCFQVDIINGHNEQELGQAAAATAKKFFPPSEGYEIQKIAMMEVQQFLTAEVKEAFIHVQAFAAYRYLDPSMTQVAVSMSSFATEQESPPDRDELAFFTSHFPESNGWEQHTQFEHTFEVNLINAPGHSLHAN